MYGYNKKELLDFISGVLSDCEASIGKIAERGYNLPGYLGQGISRTALSFSEYPNIVFKVCVGEDAEICNYAGETEVSRWRSAVEEDLAPYFAQTEYLGEVTLYCDEWVEPSEDDYGHYEIDYAHTYPVPVYIQAKVDYTWCDSEEWGRLRGKRKTALLREQKLYETTDWYNLCDVADDKLFCALFIRKYGLDEYERLCEFIADCEIEDLHSANWGIKDGDLVIIDYAM